MTSAFDKSIELLPQSDFVFFARSQFRAIALQDAESGLADALRCQTINPQYVLAHYAFGFCYLRAGRFKEAAASFKASSPDPKDPFWALRRFLMAVAEYCDGDYEAARGTLNTLIDIKPTVRGYRKLMVLTLKALDQKDLADQEEGKAQALTDVPSVFVHNPPLPPEFQWLSDALAPKREDG